MSTIAARPIAETPAFVAFPPRGRNRVGQIPGFGLSFGVTVSYLSALVLIPLAMLFVAVASHPVRELWAAVTGPRALSAYALSFGASALAASLNVIFGFVVAWVLARYRFPGRALVDALVDLPFALPTAVAGIALTAIYSESGAVGGWLARRGIQAAFSPTGVVIALTFVGLPFVVRTLEPVVRTLDPQLEEAAALLGASRVRAFFTVILPPLVPALLTGFSLAFARALGEYGSVVFISGNMPLKTEIVPLLIVTKLEQFDYAGAAALAVVILLLSFGMLLAVGALQARLKQRWVRPT
jgi:sulfate transport system permease protein